ncbi:MAG: phosphoribosyl-AMP cyclohydrolase [Pseudomonadota bacterium]
MPITETDLEQARIAWGDALIKISKTYEADGIDGARALAGDVLDAAYGYNLGPVLFKPTLASGEQTFRTNRKGALSYFVGHDPDYPLDGGFGIKGWRKCESETAASFIEGDVAMWMGWIILTDKDGQITKVDKSWGYKKDSDGTMRIVLHHSSLPYQPEATAGT